MEDNGAFVIFCFEKIMKNMFFAIFFQSELQKN